MPKKQFPSLIIYDDREWVADGLSRYTGTRRYSSLHVRGRSARASFVDALPDGARSQVVMIEPNSNLDTPEAALPGLRKDEGVLVVSARGAVVDPGLLAQVVQRLPFSDQIVVDRLHHPLFVYYPQGELLRERWDLFRTAPLHAAPDAEPDATVLTGQPVLMDIGELDNLLAYIAGATVARSFNEVSFNDLIYRKRSTNKEKMRAEHDYYSLIPASMKPWMAGAFDYREEGETAEYSMLRYHFADSAFQWVHNAWLPDQYEAFLSRILFFLSSRPARKASGSELEAAAEGLFLTKVEERWAKLLADPKGAALINNIANTPGGDRVVGAYEDYLTLARKRWKGLSAGHLTIGHGDPCLSNILYDPATATMKLIDPRGATSEDELWTHPLYDYCKLSHSILGDYDFINTLTFDISLDDEARHKLSLLRSTPPAFKREFERQVSRVEDLASIRLGEASLFLSMLPLHLDHPRKVVAFLLRARQILDDIAAG
ncbi:MAG: hypothetical protein KDA53_04835 [Hyphomonas sp.]|nr:hypothetical protein [Hyphomonas sp.]